MSNFFVPNNVYEERMAICKSCSYYSSLLGNCSVCKCFMKIKTRIAPMECPKKYWRKTTEIEVIKELPPEQIKAVLEVWELIKNGVCKTHEDKKRMIEVYNTITNSNYAYGTGCGSCLSSIYFTMSQLYEKYK